MTHHVAVLLGSLMPHITKCLWCTWICTSVFRVNACIFYVTDFYLDNLLRSLPTSATLWSYECYRKKACSSSALWLFLMFIIHGPVIVWPWRCIHYSTGNVEVCFHILTSSHIKLTQWEMARLASGSQNTIFFSFLVPALYYTTAVLLLLWTKISCSSGFEEIWKSSLCKAILTTE